MRIDRYWKQAAAGLLAIMTLTMTGGNLDSLAMTNSQPLKAQGQMLSSPDKIIIRDEGDNAQSFQAAAASQPVIQTKAQIAAFGEVTTPKTIPPPCLGPAVSPCWPIMTRRPSFCRSSSRRERAVSS